MTATVVSHDKRNVSGTRQRSARESRPQPSDHNSLSYDIHLNSVKRLKSSAIQLRRSADQDELNDADPDLLSDFRSSIFDVNTSFNVDFRRFSGDFRRGTTTRAYRKTTQADSPYLQCRTRKTGVGKVDLMLR